MLVVTKCANGIEQCSGNLEKIEKDGIVVYEGDATVLPFAKAEDNDCLSKLIKPDTNYWLDILVATVTHYTEFQLRCFTANAAAGLPEIRDIVYFRTKPPVPQGTSAENTFLKRMEIIFCMSAFLVRTFQQLRRN